MYNDMSFGVVCWVD